MGSKSSNLEHLKANGIRVPTGFTVPSSYFSKTVSGCFHKILAGMSDESTVIHALFGQPLDELERYLDEHCRDFPDGTAFAVRSSGAVVSNGSKIEEDGASVSLAGQFESYLNVDRERLVEAVLMCWASLFNARSQSSFNVNEDYAKKSKMDVVIQELIPAKLSAVMMTSIPGGDPDQGAFEACWGACGALVSGIVSPDEVVFLRNGGNIIEKCIGDKEIRMEIDAFKGSAKNERRVKNNALQQQTLCVTDAEIYRIVEAGHKIETAFGGVPQDIELVIDKKGEIVVVQSRPITTLSRKPIDFRLSDGRV